MAGCNCLIEMQKGKVPEVMQEKIAEVLLL